MFKIIFVASIAETHLAFLQGQASALQKLGYKIILVSSPSERLEQLCHNENFEYKPINIGRRISLFRDGLVTIRLFFLFLWQKPELVHLSTPKAAFLGSIAAFFSRVPNRLFLIRGSVTGADRGWSPTLNRWSEWLTVRLSNEVIVVSPSLLNFLRDQRVLKKHEGRVIANGMSNGIDFKRFKSACRSDPEAHCTNSVIGFVGRLNKEKGIDELAECWARLREKFPETRLLLVGPWDTEAEICGDLRKRLEGDPRVEITGRVDDVRLFYERMRVLCFPSHREGFPNVVMEAAAMGVPTVGAKAVGTIDAVVDGRTGTLVSIGNVSELMVALEQYLLNPKLARQHGENGRQRVVTDFSQAAIWNGLRIYYEESIHRSNNRKGFYRSVFKPVSDRVLALVALVILSPLLFSVSVLVRLSLGNPIFFSQECTGYKGRTFRLWKFRTMINSCDANGDRLPDDQRMTPIGKFLRSTSLDELPELWSILCGRMSFVGPRPLIIENRSRYSMSQRQRWNILPGLTGLARVKGGKQLSWNKEFQYDLFYVKKYSFLLDVGVIFSTIKQVLQRNGIVGSQGASVTKFHPLAPQLTAIESNVNREVLKAEPKALPLLKSRKTFVEVEDAKWPRFDEEEILAVEQVLRSGKVNYWTGKEGKTFEKEFADYVGVKYGIAVANGTVALELALEALGITEGDEVIVPSRTFIASASAVVMRGAVPKIADIDPVSQNISVNSICDRLSSRTKAIIVVHLGGWPCDMDEILALAKKHKLFVIEDCAQAHGARYKGKHVGSFGDIAAFSFCQDKIMTTAGEGGIVVTNDSSLWKRAWSFKDHGKDWDLVNHPSDGTYRFLHTSFGTNWRMTEVQAAIGRLQLKKLDNWHAERRANAALLSQRLTTCPGLVIPRPPDYCNHAFYRLYASIQLKDLKNGWTRDEIIKQLRLKDVEVGSGSCAEIYRETAFKQNFEVHSLPNACHAQQTSLAFLVHPGITSANLSNVANVTRQILKQATKYPMHKQKSAA